MEVGGRGSYEGKMEQGTEQGKRGVFPHQMATNASVKI